MKIRYSKEVDALYIRLNENKIVDSDEINENIIVDYDAQGNIVAIEILHASDKVDIDEIFIRALPKVLVET
ncbi:DUF2283 domain-containing protein [Thermosipho ferrireducens]|uniref:DUF2283 domain-containing protein n=1 Tax=Thermosipho ferrireducens TaxID=2571116 RepID=A0ABX7SAW5_9BACT|nr:DUF2283 domain-containing protein [Thermosipho ferrireducens]QTA38475.1 DUF2283 domain-containing protein [Thermosipho ferrireducens]